ncbi:hypothetical protein EGL69_13610 [Vibrio parahaemolyticus]|uniref:hypothetical protein n=1 Tax=Vibrio parahaemolyticus TaxID=670 RepID=UPI00100DE629|nr:hypothetical protein [Vibrio parahaemolyticus]RXQ03304.1 hypothetical protein EGL69_13610 [Vibrio parahaemolyticus]
MRVNHTFLFIFILIGACVSCSPLAETGLHSPSQYFEHKAESANTVDVSKVGKSNEGGLLSSSTSSSNKVETQAPTIVVRDIVKIVSGSQPSYTIQVAIESPSRDVQDKDISWSDIGSIGAVILSVLTLLYTQYQNRKLKQQSIEEVFWMREVLIPHFMDNFLQFVKDAPSRFSESNQNKGRFYAQYALERLNALRESLILVQAIDTSLKIKLDQAIEEFDEFMGEDGDMDTSTLNDVLADMTKKVIQAIQKAQYDLA